LNRPNRSKHEIVTDILRAVEQDGSTISEIQFKTYISNRHLKKYLTYLVQNELIIYAKMEKRFRITQRGLHALDTYAKIDDLLVRKALHKMMNRSEYFTPFP